MQQSKPNPISKNWLMGHSLSRSGKGRAIMGWGYTCPVCGKKNEASGYYGYGYGTRNSRKVAKDHLHKHMKGHGGPGLGV